MAEGNENVAEIMTDTERPIESARESAAAATLTNAERLARASQLFAEAERLFAEASALYKQAATNSPVPQPFQTETTEPTPE